MSHMFISVGKTEVQVCLFGAALFQIIRKNREDNPLVLVRVNLGQIVTFVLVNKKDIARLEIVKAVINQKLPSAGYGIINLITIVYMNVHRLFVIVQMCRRKTLFLNAGTDGVLAGFAKIHKNLPW